jgi:hypothetical protein
MRDLGEMRAVENKDAGQSIASAAPKDLAPSPES